jgi:NADPH:quinone reductase-like Zn-dependent oxidoreductase
MKAVVITDYGTNDVLRTAELPIPQPGPTEVLVRIHATGLNPVDFKIREGHLKELFPVEFPRVLGGDISGVVVDTGPLVKDFKQGDAVYFSNPLDRNGGFAEFVTVDQSIVALKPKTLSHTEAASLPVVGLTSVQALRDFAGVKKGDRVLIHAGAGGVGSFAIQYAKYLGAEVYTTASSQRSDYLKSLGADRVIDYKTEDFVDVAQNAGGMDVVFESIGGNNYLRSILATKKGGAVPAIVNPPDAETESLAKKKNIKTSFMLLQGSRQDLRHIAELIDRGIVKTSVSKTFALDDVALGLAELENGRTQGKLIVEILPN